MANKSQSVGDAPRELSYQYIKGITNDFDDNLIIGRGGFGTVYKGVLDEGKVIAVKVFHVETIDNSKFQKEFQNLKRLKHQNVVKLVGYCNDQEKIYMEHAGKQVIADKNHTALCLEYVHNGSLGKHITDEFIGFDWRTRYKIIKGVCEGLKYLHEEMDILHLDLKPDNILLDENMVPKITDFGLSRLFGEDNKTKTITSVGTRGYWPPEYIEHGVITKQFDIFSLGVIIVKLIAGKNCFERIDEMTTQEFVDDVHLNWRKRLGGRMSPRFQNVYCKQVKRCIEIALKCMARNRRDRLTIQHIMSDLNETETTMGVLGLQIEQFREEDPITPKKNIPKKPSTEIGADISSSKTQESKCTVLSTLPKEIPFDILRKSTDQFSRDQILYTDAFGDVYKGTMPDGQVIVVKKLAENSPLAREKAFTNVVQNCMALWHQNLVKLVGFCHEGQKKVVVNNGRYIVADIFESLLCYEYCPMGSLDKYIFHGSTMSWATRFKIIMGICEGLRFLHSIPIVHMDLKPESVLLDTDMGAKITNFALSRLFGAEQTRMNTHNIVGAHGYMAPEYLYRGEISTQTDIYSLGITIMEIVISEQNRTDSQSGRIFIEKVRETWTTDHIVSVYASVDGDALQQIVTCIAIGLDCVQIDRKKRPSIENIINSLRGSYRC